MPSIVKWKDKIHIIDLIWLGLTWFVDVEVVDWKQIKEATSFLSKNIYCRHLRQRGRLQLLFGKSVSNRKWSRKQQMKYYIKLMFYLIIVTCIWCWYWNRNFGRRSITYNFTLPTSVQQTRPWQVKNECNQQRNQQIHRNT